MCACTPAKEVAKSQRRIVYDVVDDGDWQDEAGKDPHVLGDQVLCESEAAWITTILLLLTPVRGHGCNWLKLAHKSIRDCLAKRKTLENTENILFELKDLQKL